MCIPACRSHSHVIMYSVLLVPVSGMLRWRHHVNQVRGRGEAVRFGEGPGAGEGVQHELLDPRRVDMEATLIGAVEAISLLEAVAFDTEGVVLGRASPLTIATFRSVESLSAPAYVVDVLALGADRGERPRSAQAIAYAANDAHIIHELLQAMRAKAELSATLALAVKDHSARYENQFRSLPDNSPHGKDFVMEEHPIGGSRRRTQPGTWKVGICGVAPALALPGHANLVSGHEEWYTEAGHSKIIALAQDNGFFNAKQLTRIRNPPSLGRQGSDDDYYPDFDSDDYPDF
ncbi:hypothetical protein T492DRAFT_1133240 [Pavlovales sp. CCMP2436]|nr:hypothetical protein T492DRAFT_1119140 [Pavlovales sp. CCMP2436]KAJ1634906.1 hypothetical protein T492DRAFT_1133240 [Pavlovales sp. CCMP2436]